MTGPDIKQLKNTWVRYRVLAEFSIECRGLASESGICTVGSADSNEVPLYATLSIRYRSCGINSRAMYQGRSPIYQGRASFIQVHALRYEAANGSTLPL